MNIHESAEDYLERILMIKQEKGNVRSIDIANDMNFSRASVSHAMKLLKENNYNVVGINLNNYKSDKFHVYESLKDIPHNVDIVAIIKESIHNYCIIDEMELLDIKNIYFEKGSYTEYMLKKAKEAKLNIVNFVDLYEELKLK